MNGPRHYVDRSTLFQQIWVGAALLLLLVGIAARAPVIAAVGALVLLTGGLAQLWSRLSLERVHYTRHLAQRRALVGETIEVTFRLANRKALPLPWIEVRESVPERLPVEDTHTTPSAATGALTVTHSTSLAWYERVSWRLRFRCLERGYYHFGPARLRAGDIFGLFPSEREDEQRDHVTVLPRVVDLPALGLPTRRPFGDARGGSPLFEDPSRIAGVRDYRPGDPLKRIDWTATARRQDVQARVYEPSSALHLLVALNVTTLEHVWEGYDPLRLERGVTVAGSVARWALDTRFTVGLVANCGYPGAGRAMSVAAGRDRDQATRVLEGLAMVTPFTVAPLEDVLDEAARRLPLGATIVVVAGYLPPTLAARLLRLRERGHPLSLLWVEDEPPPPLPPSIQVYALGPHLRALERSWGDRRPTAKPTAPAPSTAAGPPPRRSDDPVLQWARPTAEHTPLDA